MIWAAEWDEEHIYESRFSEIITWQACWDIQPWHCISYARNATAHVQRDTLPDSYASCKLLVSDLAYRTTTYTQ